MVGLRNILNKLPSLMVRSADSKVRSKTANLRYIHLAIHLVVVCYMQPLHVLVPHVPAFDLDCRQPCAPGNPQHVCHPQTR